MSRHRELFVRKLSVLISVYFQYGSGYQKQQTLAEFIADDLRDTLPDVIEEYMKEDK